MIGRVLSDEFFENRDWPVASAVAIFMLLLLVVPIMLFQHFEKRDAGGAASEVARRCFPARALGARARVPVRPDPVDGRVLVQQLAPGHGLGQREFADPEVVSARCSNDRQILGAAWLSIQIAVIARHGRRGPGHAGGHGAGAVRARSAAGRCLRA